MEQDSIYRVVVLEKDNAAKNEQNTALQAENERLKALLEYIGSLLIYMSVWKSKDVEAVRSTILNRIAYEAKFTGGERE